jgi:hypothetical protein
MTTIAVGVDCHEPVAGDDALAWDCLIQARLIQRIDLEPRHRLRDERARCDHQRESRVALEAAQADFSSVIRLLNLAFNLKVTLVEPRDYQIATILS